MDLFATDRAVPTRCNLARVLEAQDTGGDVKCNVHPRTQDRGFSHATEGAYLGLMQLSRARLSPGKALTLSRIDFTSSGAAHVLVDIDIVRGPHGRGPAICRPRTYMHLTIDLHGVPRDGSCIVQDTVPLIRRGKRPRALPGIKNKKKRQIPWI